MKESKWSAGPCSTRKAEKSSFQKYRPIGWWTWRAGSRAINPDCELEVVGIRPGEKSHEERITVSDSPNTVDRGKFYVILPHSDIIEPIAYCERTGATPVGLGFSYNSGTNEDFLTVDQLRELIAAHVTDPDQGR